MTKLRIASDLQLDADYVGGGTFALLAKKGAGKSYLGRVMAEEFWKAKVPFVLLDPMGTQWGLRSAADGEGDGIPIAIFGGKHGDAPLERGSGALMADLVVEEGLSMILDLSELGSRAAEREFATAFLDRLYRQNKELVHLLIDEADLFAPQKPQAGDRVLLGVTENLVRRGRNRGIGITLMTQRPAVLNKDVLTQIDGMVAMRVVGLTDREAIDKWVAGHGEDEEEAAKVKASLAGLKNGECWWWIPELGMLERVQVRESRTFDSSPTQKRNQKTRQPKGFADVNMGAIEDKMAAQIERAKAADPKELQRRIRELEKQLAARPAETVEVEREVEVLRPFLPDPIQRAIDKLGQRAEGMNAELSAIAAELATIERERKTLDAGLEAELGPRTPKRLEEKPARKLVQAPAPPPRARPAPATSNGDDVADGVSGPQQRILDALAALEAIGVPPAAKTQVALFAKASPKSSAYTNNLGALRAAGLIDYPRGGIVALEEEGRQLARADGVPATVEELHDYVASLVGGAKWRILAALIEAYPEGAEKTELAAAAGASATSSAFTNNLGSLRSLGLIDYPEKGWVAALPVLFMDGVHV